jgi:hypothetical protein
MRRKKRLGLRRGAVPAASGRHQHWSMDFVHDQLRFASIAHAQPLIEGWRRDYNAPVRLAHSVT